MSITQNPKFEEAQSKMSRARRNAKVSVDRHSLMSTATLLSLLAYRLDEGASPNEPAFGDLSIKQTLYNLASVIAQQSANDL